MDVPIDLYNYIKSEVTLKGLEENLKSKVAEGFGGQKQPVLSTLETQLSDDSKL